MEIQYRKMTEDDINTVSKMRIDQLQEEGAIPTTDLEPLLKDYYQKHIKNNTFISWLAVDNEKIVGTSGISFLERPPYYDCPSGKSGFLSGMYTLKEYRRRKIAKTLLDKIMQEAKTFGCNIVQLTASNTGMLLYTDYGFKKKENFMYYSI